MPPPLRPPQPSYRYACADLDKVGFERWRTSSDSDVANNQYYWAAEIPLEKELMGPMSSEQSCIDGVSAIAAGSSGASESLVHRFLRCELNKIIKVDVHIVKLYLSEETKQFYQLRHVCYC